MTQQRTPKANPDEKPQETPATDQATDAFVASLQALMAKHPARVSAPAVKSEDSAGKN